MTLTDAQRKRLAKAHQQAQKAQAAYRAWVVHDLTEGASFAEMSEATGLSTNTLQRWKRETR